MPEAERGGVGWVAGSDLHDICSVGGINKWLMRSHALRAAIFQQRPVIEAEEARSLPKDPAKLVLTNTS